MARKYEFRMDPENPGILGRLLLTQKQRLSLLRWSLFGLVCLVALLLQDVVLHRLYLFGAGMDLVPCLILMIAVLQDADTGSVFALAASSLYYFSGSAPGPYVIPLLTFICVFIVIFRQAYLQQGFGAVLLCAAVGLLLYELTVFGICLFLGWTIWARLGTLLLTGALTLVAVPVCYPLLRAIQKIGGEVWKE